MTTKIKLTVLAVLVISGFASAAWLIFSTNKTVPLNHASDDVATGYVDGIHYRTLENPLVPTDSRSSKPGVSVLEFFWYGCPHCQAFEPRVRQWLQTAADVDFQQLPVVWNELTNLHAAMFYVAKDAANAEQLHDKLFERVIDLRQERNIASQIEQISMEFAEHGIDPAVLGDTLLSPSIKAKVDAAALMMKQAQVASTPTILVDGQWVVLNNESVGQAGVFNVIEFLVLRAKDRS